MENQNRIQWHHYFYQHAILKRIRLRIKIGIYKIQCQQMENSWYRFGMAILLYNVLNDEVNLKSKRKIEEISDTFSILFLYANIFCCKNFYTFSVIIIWVKDSKFSLNRKVKRHQNANSGSDWNAIFKNNKQWMILQYAWWTTITHIALTWYFKSHL